MKGNKGSKLQELQKKLRNSEGKCEKCGRTYYLTVDHIIPTHFLMSLNLIDETHNWEDNFEIICGACNKFKASMFDVSHPKTFDLLKEAIARSEKQLNK